MAVSNDNIWFKRNPSDTVWWQDNGRIGVMIFSFDRIIEYNLFQDYPWKLSAEQKAVFDRENPFWANFFASRSESQNNGK